MVIVREVSRFKPVTVTKAYPLVHGRNPFGLEAWGRTGRLRDTYSYIRVVNIPSVTGFTVTGFTGFGLSPALVTGFDRL
jgi:hypothetical protein